MKRSLLLCLPAILVLSCSSPSPKETAQQFIKAVHASDLTTATALASKDTKATVDKARKEKKVTQSPEESFQFGTLSESVTGNKAEVKNEIVTIPMVKEDDGWKVVSNETLLADIQNREETLSNLKTKWETLLKEYEARTNLAKEYISYKKSLGSLSPQAKALDETASRLTPEKNWTREKVLAYAQTQKELVKAVDNALEPSLAANTDLTMNYFMQFSAAGDRIKAAESSYQLLAEKAQSQVFVPLPSAPANSMQVKKN